MDAIVHEEIRRLHSLLDSERVGIELEQNNTLLPAKEIGALGNVGYRANGSRIFVSIYIFESIGEHKNAVDTLHSSIDTEGKKVLHGINGRMLFFGYADTTGSGGTDAGFQSGKIAAAFAGDE